MRRGLWSFVTSIIYSAAIIMLIAFVFYAFADAFTPPKNGDAQLQTVQNLVKTPGSGTVSLSQYETLFIGFPYRSSDPNSACLKQVKSMGGTCEKGTLCACYEYYNPHKTTNVACRSLVTLDDPTLVHVTKGQAGVTFADQTATKGAFDCAYATGTGLYQIDYSNQQHQITFTRASK